MKSKESKYWDGLAALGPEASVIDPNDKRGVKNAYIKFLRDEQIWTIFNTLENDSLVLDFGCGSGNISSYLSNMGLRTIGIDISIELLKLASNNVNKEVSNFIHYDGKSIPIESNQFSGAVTYVVLSYITEDDELKNILKQILCSLKPGAKFVVIEQTKGKAKICDDGNKLQRTKKSYIDIFSEIGFKVNQTKDIRSGHFLFLYALRYGLMGKKSFVRLKNIEKKLIKLIPIPKFDYRETLFVLSK